MKIKYSVVGTVLIFMLVGSVVVLRALRPVSHIQDFSKTSNKAKGPENAPVQIVEYSDFECPACQKAAEFVVEVLKAYPGKIRFSFRHFPLQSHRWSPIAHSAAECAAQKDSFWEYHDMLYLNQTAWSASANPTEDFFRMAKDLGLDLDAFAACIENPKIKEAILRERAQGDALKIQATPTFFINGERVVGPLEFKIKADAIIRRLLKLPALPAALPEIPEAPYETKRLSS